MFGWLRKGGTEGRPPRASGGGDDLFDEEFQRKLDVLALVSRRLVAGRTRAERRSKKTGAGIEFADHRQYAPGDDFRYLDWNLYARTGRLLLRLYEEEEDLSVYVLLDVSRSMAFGEPRSKLDYAKRLAAALSYIALANLDRVSIVTFADEVVGRLPPTRGSKNRIFKAFEFLRPLEAEGRTGTTDAMKTFVAQNKRRGVAILISDLYDPTGFEGGINTLRYHKFEPYVIQVFDPVEVRPPLHGDVRLVDNETGEMREVTITPRVLERYAEAHAAYRARIEDFCTSKQVPYYALETSTPFDEAILDILRRGGMVA
ncbi:MAG TPA: DUF58 domain-containing protein [Sandaracinaceae bacterium LLY-WYZ-13_1]|nr:DUF58 domain-containing protein [Sandaracinaceae bacterium LLY-WYZ-13_1]